MSITRASPSPSSSSSVTQHEVEKDLVVSKDLPLNKYQGTNPNDPDQVTWNGPDDPQNPQNWSTSRKWFITLLCCIVTINVTFASSSATVVSPYIAAEFNVNYYVSQLVTTMFLLGYVVGPMIWGAGSEVVGRRTVFAVAMSIYTILHLGQALAHNIATLLIFRFLGGLFASAPLTNCGGVIADTWDAVGRGPAATLFLCSVFLGSITGPIVGSFIISSSLGWRWVFWVMMIFAGTCTVTAIIFLPETYTPVLLQRKAQHLRKLDPVANKDVYAQQERGDRSFMGLLRRTVFKAFIMLANEPILVLMTFYLSVVYGLLFGLFDLIPYIFMDLRGFSIRQSGLIFIGVGIGTSCGVIINLFLLKGYKDLTKQWRGFPPPERRLFGAMVGGPCLVIGLFWLGWTGPYTSVPWYVPGISLIFIGAGFSAVFASGVAYIVDTYLTASASALAANTMVRSAVAATFPLFTLRMFTKLGTNWAATLLALVALVLMPSPFLFYKFGAQIRTKSKFAACIDLKIAAQIKAEQAQGAPDNSV